MQIINSDFASSFTPGGLNYQAVVYTATDQAWYQNCTAEQLHDCHMQQCEPKDLSTVSIRQCDDVTMYMAGGKDASKAVLSGTTLRARHGQDV